MTYKDKTERLDSIFYELAAISITVLVLETEKDHLLATFSEEENKLWTDKVTQDYYESLTSQRN